jgi:AbrB family looped-hinge helix DNA binding protein
MNTVKISSKYQIVVPKQARKALGLAAGDELVVVAREGRIELIPRPKSYTAATLGLGSEVWEGIDAVKYARGERESWEKKKTAG